MNNALTIDDQELLDLLENITELTTFAGVREWKGRVTAGIERATGFIRGAEVEIIRETQVLEKIQYEQSKKMFGGLLSKSAEEKELLKKLDRLKTVKAEYQKANQQLQEFLDFAPKSPEEKSELLAELRLQKKSLQEKKREITQVVRGPRMAAAAPEEQSSSVFSPATLTRRKERYERLAHPLPNESTSETIARQIRRLEQDINWVETFN